MRSFRRYWLEIGLTAVGCAIAARYLAPAPPPSESKPEPPKKPEPRKRFVEPAKPEPPRALSTWNIDRVTPGMTYEQVLKLLGSPSQITIERDDWIGLYWRERNTVYFQGGIAFACFGSHLYQGPKQIKSSAKDLGRLAEDFRKRPRERLADKMVVA